MHEGKSESPYKLFLCFCQLVGVTRVDGRKVCVVKLIGLFPDSDLAFVVIDLIQKEPGFQSVLRVLFDELSLEL